MINKKTGNSKFSPIYDCGSALNPMLEDEEIEKMSEIELKNLAMNSYSCLKENGKKIHYINYMRKTENVECQNAIRRMYPNIKIKEIIDFVDSIEQISKIRRKFYKKKMIQRYEKIKEIYQDMRRKDN